MTDTNALKGSDSSIPDLTSLAAGKGRKTGSKEDVSKNEFLQILVTQLKSQDPLDPMKNDQFAVDLAQFSQLEQLISINDKMGAAGDVSSLAGYLGQEVSLGGDTVEFADGAAGSLGFTLAAPGPVRIDLTDEAGQVVGTQELGALEAGRHVVPVAADLPDGVYGFSVTASVPGAGDVKPEAAVVGTVTGFVPGADPKLIVDGREVPPSSITAVRTPGG